MLAAIVLVAVLIGGNYSMLKFALDHTTPIALAAMRVTLGGSALLAFAFWRGERLPSDRRDWLNIAAVSFSITTCSSGLLILGVNRVSAGVAALISGTLPFFTALLALALLRTRVPRLGVIGLAVGLGGTLVLSSPALGGDSSLAGVLLLVAAVVAWAFGTVYMKWQDFTRVSPVMLVGIQLYMSALVLIPTALIVEGTGDIDWSLGLLWPVLYAAIPANAVTFALLATVVARATPTQAAATAYLIPMFGVFFGWLLRDERLGGIELLGGGLVVVGVYLVVSANARQVTTA